MRYISIPATLVLIVAATATQAFAIDLPQRKPGLWQVTSHSPSGDMPSHEVRMCIDASTDAAMSALGTNTTHGVCDKNDIKRDGAVVTTESVCKVGQTQTSTRAVTRFDGDSAYHTDINTTFNPPMMGHSTAVVAQDAKWIGACPDGVSPGDLLMPNGVKLNIKTILNGQEQKN